MKNYVMLKQGINISEITTELYYALWYTSYTYNKFGYNLTITSGRDGKHMTGSRHYTGNALDFRTYDVKTQDLTQIVKYITYHLEPKGYKVILEKDHLHIQF